MTKFTLLTAAFLALAAPALAESEGTLDAATEARVKTELTAQGYDVRSVGVEDGMIEVYAVKDGKTLELYLDADLKIVRTVGE